MNSRDEFYAERDLRTREFGVPDLFEIPVSVVVGKDCAGSPEGQFALLALINMLARLHRTLCLSIPSVPLVKKTLIEADRLDEAAISLATEIDPFIRIDTSTISRNAIGLGQDVPREIPWHVGALGQLAVLDTRPVGFCGKERSLGAGLAACLAAANLLRQVMGSAIRTARISAWDFREGPHAGSGPSSFGPIDVGRVLQIGAGGVGSCFAYWVHEFGHNGPWWIIERDWTKLHNTNRSLALFPRHAGWFGGPVMNKAEVAAGLTNATSACVWYDEFDHAAFRPDVILPLANERSVRHLVASRGDSIVLHSTTSRGWESQLHRHIAGRDDCIVCRMPEQKASVQFECATAQLKPEEGPSTDAALPFLSAAAGLALVSGLYRLQFDELHEDENNLWACCFKDARRHSRQAFHSCRDGCSQTLAAPVRRQIHQKTRWSRLDAAAWAS
jgi:hypothetical protein